MHLYMCLKNPNYKAHENFMRKVCIPRRMKQEESDNSKILRNIEET